MEIVYFYRNYLTQTHLEVVGENSENLFKLIEDKIEEAKSSEFLTILGDALTPKEVELIQHFSNFHNEDNVQVVPFDINKYPYLILNHHLLYYEGKGVIHEEVIDGILRNFGTKILLPSKREDIDISNVSMNSAEYTTTLNLFDYPIIEYYNLLLREEQLYMIISNLNLDLTMYNTRSQMINAISKQLINTQTLKLILKSMDINERKALKQKVLSGQILFTEAEYHWEDIMLFGIAIPYQSGVSIIHEAIFDELQTIFKGENYERK